MTSYSIVVRLRRTTTEEGYVRVPVTDAVMRDDGMLRLDAAKVMAEAVRLAAGLDAWAVEERVVVPHPVQRARPSDER